GTPTWIQLIPNGAAGSPSPRSIGGGGASSPAPYNEGNNRLIVVGGAGETIAPSAAHEVWLLLNANGLGGPANWIELTDQTVPGGAAGGLATYDPSTDRVVQFAVLPSNDTFVLAN